MKNLMLMLAFMTSTVLVSAQNTSGILGEWEFVDSDGHGKYSLFEHEGKIYGLMYYWKDDKEEMSLEEEWKKATGENTTDVEQLSADDIFKYLKELVILTDFEAKGNKWEGEIIYDDKGSRVDGSLRLLSAKELEVGYSKWGFSDKNIWRRVE